MAKKPTKKIAGKDADQYMLRLPGGLRDRVAKRAAENGRSMNTEIIEAIEKHLQGVDRITELWAFFEKHRGNIEAIADINSRVDNLEFEARPLIEERDAARAARAWQEEEARRASLPPITAEQAEKIRALIEETRANEAKLLAVLRASSIAEIKDFEQAVYLLQRRRKGKNPPA